MFENVEKVLNEFGADILSDLSKGLPPGKDATFKLREQLENPDLSISVRRFGMNFNFKLTLLDYYINVNNGRRPGAPPPPVSNILQWIRDKRLVITAGKLQVRNQLSPGGLKVHLLADGLNGLSMAFAISRSIAKKGIKPVPFFTNATRPEVWAKLQEDLRVAAGRDITIEIKEGLKTS
jgi:hypothetical protein